MHQCLGDIERGFEGEEERARLKYHGNFLYMAH